MELKTLRNELEGWRLVATEAQERVAKLDEDLKAAHLELKQLKADASSRPASASSSSSGAATGAASGGGSGASAGGGSARAGYSSRTSQQATTRDAPAPTRARSSFLNKGLAEDGARSRVGARP